MLKCKGIIVIGLVLLLVPCGLFAAEGERAITRRFGIFIGSNNGGRDRVMLHYAVSDAKSLSRIFASMGGITEEDNILLVEPSVREINRQLDNFSRLTSQTKRNVQRTELIFYYSGHSDGNGILLNRERYGYRELRSRIDTVQADMKIVILDSCSSGAITRAKGGVKTQPFLFDSSVSAEGYAILTSSSEDEVSQESDSIESSYFTHSLLAGLRGAADSVGDGRVTLNELYRYAYTETLAKTETSVYGTQHPSYDIQISGSGDVVLTDIKEISASLLIAEELTGRISIRDNSDYLVAELTKVSPKPMELGLEPGLYRITLQRGDNFYRTEITLSENNRSTLGMADFDMIAAASGSRRRGDTTGDEFGIQDRESDDGTQVQSLNLQILPSFNMLGKNRNNSTDTLLIGIFAGIGHNIDGVGVGTFGLINTGNVRGVQGSGFVNITLGDVKGTQGTGFVNYAGGDIRGVQAAGFVNMALGDVNGVQGTGFVNIAGGSVQYIQGSGFVNYAGGDVTGVQGTGFVNIAGGNVKGLQGSGFVNYAGEIQGVQASIVNINQGGYGVMLGIVNISGSEDIFPVGLVNIIKNGILHPAVYVDDMLFTNFSFRSGSKNFYAVLGFGLGGDVLFGRSDDRFFTTRAGIGFEYAVNKLFFNIDATGGHIFNRNTAEKAFSDETGAGDYWSVDPVTFENATTQTFQLRFTAGYKFFEHLGVFGGISYDYFYKYRDNSPDPRDFGGPVMGGIHDRNYHKLGLFAGIQL